VFKKIFIAAALCAVAACAQPYQGAQQQCEDVPGVGGHCSGTEPSAASSSSASAAEAAAEMNLGAALLRAGQPSALPYGAYQLPSNGVSCTYGGGYMNCR
jgi:hypothetical protein